MYRINEYIRKYDEVEDIINRSLLVKPLDVAYRNIELSKHYFLKAKPQLKSYVAQHLVNNIDKLRESK